MKIIIADDHAVVRSGFMYILNYQDDMEVVATAADGLEASDQVAKERRRYIAHQSSMPPGESGLIATGKIKEDFPDTKVIILTMYDDEEYLFHVLKNGAAGYVLKNSPDEELLSAIRTVYDGGTYIHPSMATSLVRQFVKKDIDEAETDPYKILSRREIEVLPLSKQKAMGIKKLLRCSIFPSRQWKRINRKSWKN